MNGQIGILNVGAGDTKLTFDKSNPQECIRAARIVRDMLRRGYALLIEVDDGKGGKTTRRATDFDENTYEYIIADLDPEVAAAADLKEKASATDEPEAAAPGGATPKASGGRRSTRRVPATESRAVAVARTAGG